MAKVTRKTHNFSMLQKYLHKQIYFVSGCKLRERHNAGNTKSNKKCKT